MPTTRKKVIKTVYKDENDSEPEESGDFSDSGSDAKITDVSSSEDEEQAVSSGEEFEDEDSKSSKPKKAAPRRRPQFAKNFIKKIRDEPPDDLGENSAATKAFSVKDLTDADKLLPSFLNLSESDSSDDESPRKPPSIPTNTTFSSANDADSDHETKMEYQDVWSKNIPDNSDEIAQKTFKELEIHKTKIEETKASILNYTAKNSSQAFDVKDLLAQGEEVLPEPPEVKKTKKKKKQNDSDSEMEDWEEVKESKPLPASGLQVVVDFPDAVHRKSKKLDVEMMMRRKMNRVKKEYQVYMHKVHVLCWLGHGNYVSSVLNDQEIMSAVLTLVPSKECYPGERVDVKYVEQITKWLKNKMTLVQDKHENKFKPKSPPLKDILLKEIKNKTVSTKKFMFFIFVSMLRALGLQCRVMFNFVTLPIRPPSSELCSLSTKEKEEKQNAEPKKEDTKKSAQKKSCKSKKKSKQIPQVDGNYDSDMDVDDIYFSDTNIMQVDGNDDGNIVAKSRKTRRSKASIAIEPTEKDEDVSPPKRARSAANPLNSEPSKSVSQDKILPKKRNRKASEEKSKAQETKPVKVDKNKASPASKTLSLNRRGKTIKETEPKESKNDISTTLQENSSKKDTTAKQTDPPKIIVTNENNKAVSSKFFESNSSAESSKSATRSRSKTADVKNVRNAKDSVNKNTKSRSKSAGTSETSKYFNDSAKTPTKIVPKRTKKTVRDPDDELRVSHRDLAPKIKTSPKNDVASTLIAIMKDRMEESMNNVKAIKKKTKTVKGKSKTKGDSDYEPEAASDDDFKPTKISPKPSGSRKIDRRVLSTDDEAPRDKTDVWCEVFVEELEQWIAVDVVKGQVHCTNEIYSRATHPVCYVVGWDNNNYLKDLTRRYVPHWNTVTRKQRAEPVWWDTAISPWKGPRTPRDREEDEALDRMQLDAPLPKSIAEYKNHPLYALKRHLLKYEALYPPDAATLGFVRGEAVYARDCVYICRSRDTWLKEAKVVRLGEKPYKVVKARPKWDKLSNKLITDKPLEIFGPWQVQDYEPPVAENGVVPRNAYGNVELFKACMLPKGTVHIKLPGLNKVAKKLNIDCAPAMTGFDFNGGWSHPVYDGFVVCQEFEEVITQAWLEDQEEMERREKEKTEARVYGNWKRLIKGLMIKERLKLKYGFEEPSTSDKAKGSKGPRFVTKKKK
ncbi:DNA repair protein complementing XP-C cells homolog [Leguminivora glycinivorella]|uniref:DNA repair protein complementing XP-C cells homolog n=1 Tax=Leguminivora glycinivorella TaxID=1035111 RepID=UPI00200FE3E3|nr:DNA repair protein complementing XP-C cells homolog [Leguminivora glycinivorella]